MTDPNIPGTGIKSSQVTSWLKTAKEIVYAVGIVIALYGVVTGRLNADQLSKIVSYNSQREDWTEHYVVGLGQSLAKPALDVPRAAAP